MRSIYAAVVVVLVIVVAYALWPGASKPCVEPIPLRSAMKKFGRSLAYRSGSNAMANAAEPCPPPSCADFASCSTGNLRKRMMASAARFPDIDQSKISDALAMKVLQGCDGTDAGACGDFLPYVCSCSGISDMCRNAPDPKPEVCKQNPRTPTAAYGINCSEIRLTQGPCPCDCAGGGGDSGAKGCPAITGKWTVSGGASGTAEFATRPSATALCEVVLTMPSGDVLLGYIPKDKTSSIVWSFDSASPPAAIDPSLKRIMWSDYTFTR